MTDAADDPFGLSPMPRHEVELAALPGNTNFQSQGAAKAELARRDREYAEQQEQSRRAYEDQREASRREFEIKMFEAAGNRAAVQQEQEEKLARMQADAAREAAAVQAQATKDAAEGQIRVAGRSQSRQQLPRSCP